MNSSFQNTYPNLGAGDGSSATPAYSIKSTKTETLDYDSQRRAPFTLFDNNLDTLNAVSHWAISLGKAR